MTITTADLARTLEDDRHYGWGWACCTDLPVGQYDRLEAAVVACANEAGLDYEALLVWSNSKWGRWLRDSGGPWTRRHVRNYLNRGIVLALWLEEGNTSADFCTAAVPS